MLEEARKILRLSSTTFDIEITGLINACKRDLELAGVNISDEADPLIRRSILTYVKAYFGTNDLNDRFLRDYAMLKLQLRDSGDYRVGI